MLLQLVFFQIHFASDMWERNRVDGKKKLKYNAVPTIFPHRPRETKKTSSDDFHENNGETHSRDNENGSSLESITELEDTLKTLSSLHSDTDNFLKTTVSHKKRKKMDSSQKNRKSIIELEDQTDFVEDRSVDTTIFDHSYARFPVKFETESAENDTPKLSDAEKQVS